MNSGPDAVWNRFSIGVGWTIRFYIGLIGYWMIEVRADLNLDLMIVFSWRLGVQCFRIFRSILLCGRDGMVYWGCWRKCL